MVTPEAFFMSRLPSDSRDLRHFASLTDAVQAEDAFSAELGAAPPGS